MGIINITRSSFFLSALAVVGLALLALSTGAHAQEESSIDLVAIDAIPDGNDATSLGPLDGCVDTDAGSEVTVDIVVDAIPEDQPAIGFQFDVLYDPSILQVTDYDHELFLAAEGTYQPVEGLTDPVPDSDGTFTVAVLDAASNVETDENMETGEGAIVRMTFEAIADGSSDLTISFVPPDVTYPAIISIQNEPIQVDNIGAAAVYVGEPCPADAEPVITALPPLSELEPTPAPTIDPSNFPEPEGGGIDYALLAVTVAVAAVGAGGIAGGGWLLYRRVAKS